MTFFYRLCTVLVYTFFVYAPLSAQNVPCIAISSGNGIGLQAAVLQIENGSPHFPIPDEDLPYCSQGFPANTNYVFRPVKDDDHLNGVNTYDLLLIFKHLLASSLVTDPYKLIAADVNKSNSVSATDIIDLRKLILGIYPNGLPNNTSWRFIPEFYVFPNPANPFSNNFPETTDYSEWTNYPLDTFYFKPIKVGDLDESASHNKSNPSTELSLDFSIPNRKIQKGETFILPIHFQENLSALQGTFSFDGLECISLEDQTNCSNEDFHFFEKENILTMAWFGEKNPSFTLHVRALRDGFLSEMLAFTDEKTARFAALKDGGVALPDLDFSSTTGNIIACLDFKAPHTGNYSIKHRPDSVAVQLLNVQGPGGVTPEPYILEFPDCIDLSGFPNQDYTAKLTANWDYQDEFNSFDLLLTEMHLLGQRPLNDPYLLIAADINKSGSITPTDVIEGRKLILGQYPQGWPTNDSWRFFYRGYTFPSPSNPFAHALPEIITLGSMDTNFIVPVKVGNLNGIDFKTIEPLEICVQEKIVKMGDEITIPIDAGNLLAFQGTFVFDGLEFLGHGGTSQIIVHPFPDGDCLSLCWNGINENLSFDLHMRARRDGKLSEMLFFNDSITPRMAMRPDIISAKPILVFKTPTNTEETLQTAFKFSAQPSVFSNKTTLRLEGHFPKETKQENVQIYAYNSLGQLVFEKTATTLGDAWQLDVYAHDLPVIGTYTLLARLGREQVFTRVVRF